MKKLKKRFALALTLALCALPLSASLALAENTSTGSIESTSSAETTEASDDIPAVLDENGEVVSPGTLPGSPIYWLTTLIEKLQVVLTFDPVEKTELLEEQALERIAEAAALIEQGDTEQAEDALKAYTEKVAEAQDFLALLNETDSETLLKLETALSKAHANNIQTLGGLLLLDKLPPQAAERVALNIVRSMEKSITKMDKKDQQKVALELKKMTKGLEDSGLAEEELEALEELEQTLDPQDGEVAEAIAPTSGATLNTMALTTYNVMDTTAETIKNNQQSLVQNANSKVTNQKSEVKVEPEPDKLQEQPLKDEGKVQEQEQQEGKFKAEQESASMIEKNSNSTNPAQKQEETQQKVQKERAKGDKSGGKEK